jgi:glycosyltransferase involved in cell wall biosynthesis
MNPAEISVLVITCNEDANIRRFLEGMAWAGQILVVDSGSTDATQAVCSEFPQVRVVQRAFDSFADQCNFGLGLLDTPWVLSCDADYIAEPDFAKAVRLLDDAVDGYSVPFIYCIHGKKIRSGLYPARVVLYRREAGCYYNDGHGHKVKLSGKVLPFPGRLLHDDRKPLARWLGSQGKYAAQEASKILSVDPKKLPFQDKLRRTGWAAPIGMLFYCLIFKGGLLDGWPGIFYAMQRTYAEILLSLEILEWRFNRTLN